MRNQTSMSLVKIESIPFIFEINYVYLQKCQVEDNKSEEADCYPFYDDIFGNEMMTYMNEGQNWL